MELSVFLSFESNNFRHPHCWCRRKMRTHPPHHHHQNGDIWYLIISYNFRTSSFLRFFFVWWKWYSFHPFFSLLRQLCILDSLSERNTFQTWVQKNFVWKKYCFHMFFFAFLDVLCCLEHFSTPRQPWFFFECRACLHGNVAFDADKCSCFLFQHATKFIWWKCAEI